MLEETFFALGTHWRVESSDKPQKDFMPWLTDFEQKYSRFIASSFLNHISQTPGIYALDIDGQEILELYIKINTLTNNLFTPTIGQNLVESGYDTSYSLVSKKLSSLETLDSYLALDKNILTIKKPIQLDFGGVGKGYAIDKIASFFSCDYLYINAGGDIYLKSDKSVEIALENPDDSSEAIGLIEIQNQSICGSAGNRRRWKDHHHIINPKTHSSPSDIKATWVVAPTSTIADSLATCLFLVSPEILLQEFKFEYLILDNNNHALHSKDFSVNLFNAK